MLTPLQNANIIVKGSYHCEMLLSPQNANINAKRNYHYQIFISLQTLMSLQDATITGKC